MQNNKRILGLLLVAWLAVSNCSTKTGKKIYRVIKEPFHISVSVNGHLRSSASHHIGTPAVHRVYNFTITRLAPEGKEVKKGTPLVSFDTKELMERLMRKKPELDAAKKELEKILLEEQAKIEDLKIRIAEATMKQEKEGRKAQIPEDLVAVIDAKKARMQHELARLDETLLKSQLENQKVVLDTKVKEMKAKIHRLASEIQTIQAGISNMTVMAPKNGMVVYTPDWNGKKKAVGDNCWFGSTIMELPDLTKMEVAVTIPEPEAGKIKEGQKADIRLDSNPDKVYQGQIKSLGRIFRTKSWDQPAIVFDAVISISNPDPQIMRPGMAAKVDIIIASKQEALQIPESAIIYEGDEPYVLKKGFAGAHKVKITVGSRSRGRVEVLSGLAENDRILLEGEAGVNGK